MITDWLRDPSVWTLGWLAAAMDCAAVLPLLQLAFPSASARWRLARVLLLCAFIAIAPALPSVGVRGFGNGLFAFVSRDDPIGLLRLAAYVIGAGVFVGWLVPVYTEGRSLKSMGWVAKGAPGYLAAGLAAGVVLACVLPTRDCVPHIDGVFPEQRGLSVLPLLPIQFVATCVLFALTTAWFEENVFRGLLLPALGETGLSRAWGNLWQALVFGLYHLPHDYMGSRGSNLDAPLWAVLYGAFAARFLWGMLFGWLRQRTGSIVPSFALHLAFNAVHLAIALGPMALALAGISGTAGGG